MLLQYYVSDNSGRTRDHVVVYSRSRSIFSGTTALLTSKSGVLYHVKWKVPAQVATPVKFCVTSTDPSGNKSKRSCSPVLLHH
jgi:hypothetical protein